MEKVFIVVQSIPYEGDTVMRVFGKYADAVKYADELTAEDALRTGGGFMEFDVFEREVY
jgi:hypothetical protein